MVEITNVEHSEEEVYIMPATVTWNYPIFVKEGCQFAESLK